MAISEKSPNHELIISPDSEPSHELIRIDYTLFKPERRALAKRQISRLLNKIKNHPHLKDYCLESINKIIEMER